MDDAEFTQKAETNLLFFIRSCEKGNKLLEECEFDFWNDSRNEIRLVTSFDTTEEGIETDISDINAL